MATTGCVLVSAYILGRAGSINHVDELLGFDLERLLFLWALEVGGLVLIITQTLGILRDEMER